jgi:hypothetical protein
LAENQYTSTEEDWSKEANESPTHNDQNHQKTSGGRDLHQQQQQQKSRETKAQTENYNNKTVDKNIQKPAKTQKQQLRWRKGAGWTAREIYAPAHVDHEPAREHPLEEQRPSTGSWRAMEDGERARGKPGGTKKSRSVFEKDQIENSILPDETHGEQGEWRGGRGGRQ